MDYDIHYAGRHQAENPNLCQYCGLNEVSFTISSSEIFESMRVCDDCADRWERVGWNADRIRMEGQTAPYQEEWEGIYGRLPGFDPLGDD